MKVLTGEDKVVLLLSSLAPPALESVLSRMPAEQTDRLRARLKNLTQTQPQDQLNEAAREFVDTLRISERSTSPSPAAANPTSPDLGTGANASTVRGGSASPSREGEADDPLAVLRTLPAATLSQALREERPTTIALILGCVEQKIGAELLRLLAPEVRQEVALRLVQPSTPGREVMLQIGRAVLARCQQDTEEPEPSRDDKLLRMADMVRELGREDRQAILKRFEQADPDAAEVLRKELYRFTDIVRLDGRTLQGVLAQLDMKTLAAALKKTDEHLKDKVLSNVSKRAREAVTEEMELSTSVPKARIDEAQGRVVAILQKLDQEGKLNLEPAN